jgi:hypothetical protein
VSKCQLGGICSWKKLRTVSMSMLLLVLYRCSLSTPCPCPTWSWYTKLLPSAMFTGLPGCRWRSKTGRDSKNPAGVC